MRKLFLIMMTVLACTWSLSAQNRSISGTVIDAGNNEPLVGATIAPIGGGQGAAADIDGKFTVNVPANVKKARVTCVGYTAQTVDLVNGMTVRLAASSSALDDVVVVAYGTANKESLTGSVTVVGSDQIEKRPVTTVTAALDGNAPGVQVNNTTGQPGDSPSIFIRGINTVNGSNALLYVVDGVVYNGALSDINPNDVESLSVLKDAASCALYGDRGANGVILITTRKAKKSGRAEVTLQIRQGLYNRGIPLYDRLDADSWMETTLHGYANSAVSNGTAATYADAVAQLREDFFGVVAVPNIYGVGSQELFDANGKLTRTYLPGYANDLEWWDAVSRQGHRQEYNVNAAGATDKFNVFASVGYLKEQGYLLKTDFERFSARLNANYNVTSYFKMGLNLSAMHTTSDYDDQGDTNSTLNPFLTLYRVPVQPYYAHDENGNIIYDNGVPQWNIDPAYTNTESNVAYAMRLNFNENRTLQVDANLYGTLILPYGFELTVRGTMYRRNYEAKEYSNDIIGSAKGFGRLYQNFYHYGNHAFYQQLNWAHDYGNHHVDVLLDHENYQYGYGYTTVQGRDQLFQGMYYMNNFPEIESVSAYEGMYRSESYLGRARYNYDQKYFAEFSLRRDGSSKFAKAQRWGTFWSVGASWVISKEKFMENVNWVNFLKLRLAYGSVGQNASAGYYSYLATFTRRSTLYDGLAGIYPSQLAANDSRWEATKTLDVALEGTLFNNRFNFSIGYFLKKNSDLLYNVGQPPSAGVQYTGQLLTVLTNIGDMQNYGWELSFNGDIIRNGDWRWSAGIDATFLKNKVTKLPFGRDQWNSPRALIEGKSRYEAYMFDWMGVDMLTGRSLYAIDFEGAHEWYWQNPATLQWVWLTEENLDQYTDLGATKDNIAQNLYDSKLQQGLKDGDIVEINGQYYTYDPVNYATKRFLGNMLSTVYGSFNTAVSWKGINLSVLFTYGLGGKVIDSRYSSLMSMGNSPSALHKDVLKSWTEAPAGMTAESTDRISKDAIPQVNPTYSGLNNYQSSRWLTNKNFLVFKNLNVNYDFPKKLIKPLKLQGLNLGFAVDNLVTISARKGMNPQYSMAGGQGDTFVTARVFSFSLTARF